jgi:hypothetical protein
MKALDFIFTIFSISLFAGAQNEGLNGIWTGTLTNDSSTTRKDQSF